MTDNLIVDHEKKYFTQIPNLIDDLKLSVYAFRLYVHFKRVTGESGGKCWQSTQTLSEFCCMSAHKISDAKKELQGAGLITLESVKNPDGGKNFHRISVNDIWKTNLNHFSKNQEYSRNSEKESEKLDKNGLQVPTGNLSTSPQELTTSPQEIKNNQLRSIQPKEEKKNRRRDNYNSLTAVESESSSSLFRESVLLTLKLAGRTIPPQDEGKYWDVLESVYKKALRRKKEREFWHNFEHYNRVDGRDFTTESIPGRMTRSLLTWDLNPNPDEITHLEDPDVYLTENYYSTILREFQTEYLGGA
jgi:hypothetical protein